MGLVLASVPHEHMWLLDQGHSLYLAEVSAVCPLLANTDDHVKVLGYTIGYSMRRGVLQDLMHIQDYKSHHKLRCVRMSCVHSQPSTTKTSLIFPSPPLHVNKETYRWLHL